MQKTRISKSHVTVPLLHNKNMLDEHCCAFRPATLGRFTIGRDYTLEKLHLITNSTFIEYIEYFVIYCKYRQGTFEFSVNIVKVHMLGRYQNVY